MLISDENHEFDEKHEKQQNLTKTDKIEQDIYEYNLAKFEALKRQHGIESKCNYKTLE